MSERSKKMWENPEAYGLPSRRKWTEEQLALVGTDSDRAVANVLGLPVTVVKQKRERLGISLLAQRWKEDQIALLGTARHPTANSLVCWGNPLQPSRESARNLGFLPLFSSHGPTQKSL